MEIILAVLIAIIIVVIFVYNYLDKRRFRTGRQMSFVRPIVNEWAEVTSQLLKDLDRSDKFDVREDWDSVMEECSKTRNSDRLVYYVNLMAKSYTSCLQKDADDLERLTRPEHRGKKAELESELDGFAVVYNEYVGKYNVSLSRPLVKQVSRLFRYAEWETLDFYHPPDTDG